MDIVLLRHAEAEPLGESNHFCDEERALTEGGRKQIMEVARSLKSLEMHFSLIASSPLVRARQTAEIVARVLKHSPPVMLWEELCPGASSLKVFERIKSAGPLDMILLTGHEPDMGILASSLLVRSGKIDMPFKKAGLCRIQVEQMPPLLPGELKWMVPPKLLSGFHRRKQGL